MIVIDIIPITPAPTIELMRLKLALDKLLCSVVPSSASFAWADASPLSFW